MTTVLPAPAPVLLPTLAQVREARLPVPELCPVHLELIGKQGCGRCFLDEDDAFERSQDI